MRVRLLHTLNAKHLSQFQCSPSHFTQGSDDALSVGLGQEGAGVQNAFLTVTFRSTKQRTTKKKSSKCIFPCLIMCIIYQCAEDCRLKRNYCNKFVTSGLTFQLFRTMKGGYILPKLCCYGKLHPHTVLSRFSLWLHFNSSS